MELRRLRYFLAVAQELNISNAARRLHIAQPPLSRQIQLLEEEMGVALFRRTPRRLELTDAGCAFVARARSVIEAAESAVAHARQIHRQNCGHLSLGVHEGVVCTRLPAMLAGFRGAHPAVSLQVKSLPIHALSAALAREEIDVAFLRPGMEPDAARVAPLWREPLVLALAAGHPLARRAEVGLAHCAPYAFIVQVDAHRDRILAACSQSGFVPHAVIPAEGTLAALGLAAAGLGLALVPASMQRHRLDGVVFRVLHSPSELSECTQLVWLAARASEPLRAFVRYAEEQVSKTSASNVRLLVAAQAV